MAVMLDNPSTPIDMSTLASELKLQGLPPYARPCFIRLTQNIEMTGVLLIMLRMNSNNLRCVLFS